MCVIGGKFAHGVHHFVDFLHLQAARGGDVDQHALGPGEVDPFEQRRSHGLFGGDARAIHPGGAGRTHHGHAHFAHHRAHVLEVDVNEARIVDDFSDTADGVTQNVVSRLEGFFHRHIVAQHVHQLVVEDDDQRVDVLLQFDDARFGHFQALAFETERLGHHGNGQDAHFARHFGDDRRCAGTGAAAHAGGDEDHVRTRQRLGDLFALFHRGIAPDFRLGTGPQPILAEPQFFVCDAALQGLRVGVGSDELDAHHPLADHVIDGIAAGAANADNLDDRPQIVDAVFLVDDFKHGHGALLCKKT